MYDERARRTSKVTDPNMVQKLKFYNRGKSSKDDTSTDPVLNEDEMNALIR